MLAAISNLLLNCPHRRHGASRRSPERPILHSIYSYVSKMGYAGIAHF